MERFDYCGDVRFAIVLRAGLIERWPTDCSLIVDRVYIRRIVRIIDWLAESAGVAEVVDQLARETGISPAELLLWHRQGATAVCSLGNTIELSRGVEGYQRP